MRTLALLFFFAGTASAEAGETLRIATLAPQGSSFANVIEASARQIAARTDGRVRLRFYWSGQLGDERDMVRRMRLGSLDGATLATAGLGLIDKSVLVLQLPFLFQSVDELDEVRTALGPEISARFHDAGFVLVAWGDVGWVHLYTTRPFTGFPALKSWVFPDEPFVRRLLELAGAGLVPLGLAEVLPAMTVGAIHACYGPALPALVLGWIQRVRHAIADPLSYSIAALVLSKAAWERISVEDRLTVLDVGRQTAARLRDVTRRDDALARRTMEKNGVRFEPLPARARGELEAHARTVWEEHAGGTYPRALLVRVLDLLQEIRRRAAGPRP